MASTSHLSQPQQFQTPPQAPFINNGARDRNPGIIQEPKLTYHNYLQDTHAKRKYNMSYTEYIEGLNDSLINQQDQDCPHQ